MWWWLDWPTGPIYICTCFFQPSYSCECALCLSYFAFVLVVFGGFISFKTIPAFPAGTLTIISEEHSQSMPQKRLDKLMPAFHYMQFRRSRFLGQFQLPRIPINICGWKHSEKKILSKLVTLTDSKGTDKKKVAIVPFIHSASHALEKTGYLENLNAVFSKPQQAAQFKQKR